MTGRKGGTGKTTTAMHLAAYFQQLGPTILIDADPNRSAIRWAGRGSFDFAVCELGEASDFTRGREFAHTIIDTEPRPRVSELESMSRRADLIIVTVPPASLDTDVLDIAISDITEFVTDKHRVLLTRVPPVQKDGAIVRRILAKTGMPLFEAEIPRLSAFERSPGLGLLAGQTTSPAAAKAGDSYIALGDEIIKEYGRLV